MIAVIVYYADETLTDLGTYNDYDSAYSNTSGVVRQFINSRQVIKVEYVIGDINNARS